MNEELIEAAKDGNVERVRKAIESGAEINYKDKAANTTAIGYAAGYGNLEVVKYLLTFDNIDLSPIDNENFTALTSAIFAEGENNKNLEIAQLILKKIKKYDFKNLDAYTPELFAPNALMAASLNFQRDKTPDDITFVTDLLQRGSQIRFEKGVAHTLEIRPEMYQLLHAAVNLLNIAGGNKDDFEKNRIVISSTLKLLGKGLNSRRKDGNSALHLALISNNLELAKILIKNGADLDMPNNEGITSKQLLTKMDLSREADLKDAFDRKESNEESYIKQVEQLDSLIEILNKHMKENERYFSNKNLRGCSLAYQRDNCIYYKDKYILKLAELLSNSNINVYDPKRAMELLNIISPENKKFFQKAQEMMALLKNIKTNVVSQRMSDELSLGATVVSAFDLKKQLEREEKERIEKMRLETERKIKEEYICPITNELMTDPVRINGEKIGTEAGHAYERLALELWIAEHGTHPKTQRKITEADIIADSNLKSEIEAYKLQLGKRPSK